MSVAAALLAGGALGVRHALESDHVAAVATLAREDRVGRGVAGAWWGVGHGVPVALLGLAVLLAGIRVPDELTRSAEALAGLLLVLLGAWTLLDVVAPGIRRHAHDGGPHRHLALGDQLLGIGHRHVDAGAFAVGVVHGLAGSGVIVVALVAAAPSRSAGLAFLGAFAIATVGAMAATAWCWQRLDGTRLRRPLRTVAGIAAVGIGAAMVVASVGAPFPV